MKNTFLLIYPMLTFFLILSDFDYAGAATDPCGGVYDGRTVVEPAGQGGTPATVVCVNPMKKECDDAITKMNEAKSKFDSSCRATSLGIGKSCIAKIDQCDACTENLDSCEDKESYSDFLEKMEDLEDSSIRPPSEVKNFKVYANCPAELSDKLEQLRKDAKEKKKDKETYEDELNKLKEDIQKKEAELTDVTNTYNTEQKRIESEREEAMDELTATIKGESEDLRKQYDELGSQIDEAINQITEANFAKQEALKAAELECYNLSIAQLNEFLKARTDSVAQGKLSTNGFRSLINSTGKTRKQKNATFAQQRYESCLGSMNHKNRVDSINKQHALQVEKLRKAINSINKQQGDLVLKMGGEEMRKKFEKDLKKINSTFENDMMAAQKTYMKDMKTAESELAAMREKLQLLQLRLREADLEYQALIQVENIASSEGVNEKRRGSQDADASAGRSTLKTAFDDAYGKCGCDAVSATSATTSPAAAAINPTFSTQCNSVNSIKRDYFPTATDSGGVEVRPGQQVR